jgi:hypothetical protein
MSGDVRASVALGFFAARRMNAQVITIPHSQWSDILGVRDVPVKERE